ncbi:hypothetical protein [Streptomyces sp. NPDC058401]|uniref:hypothetical protein n=1 Tax=Streptomyces sp. NPDC058401 TaxID=3346480 RepID=UPI0036471132
MHRDASGRGREQGIDWLEVAHDLPHLFARLSELVHAEGHAPEDLVVIPRSELDRRETAAFTAGWAEAMAEDLPRIRREYEKRVVDAYAAGGDAGRGGPTARRGANAGTGPGVGTGEAGRRGEGAEVIRLPFALLLDPPALVTEAEERIRRARPPVGGQPGNQDPGGQDPGDRQPGVGRSGDRQPDADHAQAAAEEPVAEEPRAHEQPGTGTLPSAQEVREKRAVPAGRKVVRRRGRPIVPPLRAVPVQPRAQAPSADSPPEGPERAEADGRRSLAQKARALAQELETRGGVGRPEPAGDGRRAGGPSPEHPE